MTAPSPYADWPTGLGAERERAPSMALNEARTAWNDKFSRPDAQALRLLHAKPELAVLDGARAALGGLAGIQESLDWQGVPWRWTFVYRGMGDLAEHATPLGSGPTPIATPSGLGLLRAFAYVIPDPSRLQICVPLTAPQIEAMPLKKMKKPVRDGIAQARSVAGVWWPTWDVGGTGAVEEVLEVAVRKHKCLLTAAAVQA